MAAPPVLVTRPADSAQRWVQALQRRGIAAQALPLIDIAPVSDPAAAQVLQQARDDWATWRAVMFVSGNAVRYFFEEKQAENLIKQAQIAIKTRVWTPGPGTLRCLLALGLSPALIDTPAPDAAQFESETLWQQVRGQILPGARVLIVRGSNHPVTPQGEGRDWLARQLTAAGAQVHCVAAYTRHPPQWDAAQRALALQAVAEGGLWLLSSAQALQHLCAALPQQRWHTARALATHPRIAVAAQAAGFGRVDTCRPALQDVITSIESLHEH